MNDEPLKDWQNCHERLWLSIAEHILVHGKTGSIGALKIKILKELNMIKLDLMYDYSLFAKALSFERLLVEYGLIKFEDDLAM